MSEAKPKATGRTLGMELARVLDLPPHWQKIVIVADVRDLVRVYVKGLLPTDQVNGIVEAVADVAVTSECSVTTVRNLLPAQEQYIADRHEESGKSG